MKKKLFLLTLWLATAMTISAYDFIVGELCYNKSSDGKSVTVVNHQGVSGSLSIPSSVTDIYGNTYSVTAIDGAFEECTDLTSVTIPSTVTYLGSRAFSGCYNLKSVTISNGVQIIDVEAFYGCVSLASVSIPNSVTTIGHGAFASSGLTSVTIGSSVTSIGERAFSASGLKTVYWNAKNCNDFSWGSSSPFQDCDNLQTIVIGSGVEKIPALFMISKTSLKSVTIGNSVTSIGNFAFYRCSGLTSITIPNSVTSIGHSAFNGCSGLNNIYSNIKDPGKVSMGSLVFSGIGGSCYLWVPANTVATYKSLAEWNVFTLCYAKTESILITDNGTSVYAGGSITLNAQVSPSDANSNVTWSSNNTSVATVDQTGKVTAKKVGTATISATATDGSGVRATRQISIKGITKISLNKASLQVGIGSTEQLSATITPNDVIIKTLNWSSSNSNVATVDQTGKVTARKAGTATITAAATDGSGVTVSCQVTVTGITNITLNKTEGQMYVGGTEQLQAMITPSDAIINTLTWSSSDTSVATVDQTGKVTAKKIGTATITVAATDGSGVTASCEVAVTGITKISLNKSIAKVYKGGSEQLEATITPNDVIINTLTWSSSNTNVATVDQNGKVTAKELGSAIITAASTDGSGVKAICKVSVTGVKNISLNKTTAQVYVGGTEQLEATITPSDVIINTLTWSSSDTSVATVDPTGKVTAVAPGSAVITAAATDGTGREAICEVTVSGVEQITLNKTETQVYVGGTEQLTATITPADVIINTIQWSSNNPSVATVDQNGRVTAVAPGTAIVTAAATDGTGVKATCQVTVGGISSITLNKEAVTIYKGETETLTATLEPADVIMRDITWSSNNVAIATVDQNGVVTARATGTATISASATDGSGLVATCFVTVEPAYSLSSPDIDCVRGETVEVPISFFNRQTISALEFVMKVPKIMTIRTDNYGDYDVWLDDARRTRNHTVMLEPAGSNSSYTFYKVVISSATNNSLKGHEGVLLHVMLEPNHSAATGDFNLQFTALTCAEPDETQHEDDDSSGLIHQSYLVGDANADVNVDVADYVCTANYILGREISSEFYEDAANANYKDNTINVTDLVAIVNYGLEIKDKEYHPSRLTSAGTAADGIDYALEARVASVVAKSTAVDISLDNDRPLAAMQLDLNLPSGVAVESVAMSGRAKDIDATIGVAPDGKSRLIVAGFGLGSIEAGTGRLMTISLTGDVRQGDMMSIENVVMTERDLTEHATLAPVLLDISAPSGIGGASCDHVEIYVDRGSIVIESPVAGTARLTRLNGQSRLVEVKPGVNVYEVTTSIGDVIIASFGDIVKKFQF